MMATRNRGSFLLRRIVALHNCSYQQKATIYSKFEGIDYNKYLSALRNYTDLDFQKVHKYGSDYKKDQNKVNQTFDESLRYRVGIELATAHFILQRGGAVKFVDSNRWVEPEKLSAWGMYRRKSSYTLPTKKVPGFKVEAIDASGLDILYESFEMLEELQYLKYLNVSKCKYFDDWCFQRLLPVGETLLVVDVSGCPLVTERGLASLHKMSKLKRIICHDMPAIRNPALSKLLLEEMMPNSVIEGLTDYTDPAALENSEPIEEPMIGAPSVQLAEYITAGEWHSVDDLVEEEEKEKEEERKLLTTGTEPELDTVVDVRDNKKGT